jgi:small subunit ribosomal protein S8
MDTIADFLTKIRNAQHGKHDSVTCSHSKIKEAIGKILEKEGFVEHVSIVKGEKYPEIKVRLFENREINLRRVSKPGQRIYVKATEIQKVRNGLGTGIISTSQGIMTTKEARTKKLGGELLCTVF